MTTLAQLNKYHEQEALAHIRKTIDNTMPKGLFEDIAWMYEEVRFRKQHGRANRVYDRLNYLDLRALALSLGRMNNAS